MWSKNGCLEQNMQDGGKLQKKVLNQLNKASKH